MLTLLINVSGQIQINEVVSSNSEYLDSNGDSPDWIELYNAGSSEISLENWTITDDQETPKKWTFGNASITAGGYMVIWASGKDRPTISRPTTLIDRGDSWKYITPTQSIADSWIETGFDDEAWQEGNSGFGYADGDDETAIPPGTLSVFLRKKFTLSNPDAITELLLDIDYDDAFVAYINGIEVARANINGARPSYNATSITDHEAQIYTGGRPDRFVISSDLLIDGDNILAIQGHNISQNSSDFTIIPYLSAYANEPISTGVTSPSILQLSDRSLHTNFKLSTAETLYLYDDNGVEVSSIAIQNTPPNVSLGRRPGDQEVVLYSPTTPGHPNGQNGFAGYVEGGISFSNDGGTVSPMSLTLSTDDDEAIMRYTLDATIPDENAQVYTQPLDITTNTVVRARLFKQGYIASATSSRTYIIDNTHSLPIMSLVTEPANLFSDATGIYVLGDGDFEDYPFMGSNIWEDWERPVNVSFSEPDGTRINFDAGVKIFGGWSRAQDQRSFSIFARGQYGTPEIDYPLFPDNPYDKYQAFVLRNSGNDFLRTNIRDAALTSLMNGSGIETQRYRPVATYINGQYWGFYNMREKVNEHYLASKRGVATDDIDLIGPSGSLIHGSADDFNSMMEYLGSNTLISQSNYNEITAQVDIDNFIMYQLAQIYFGNTDWPGNNIKLWKPKAGKWRWILYDTDFGFGIWNAYGYFDNTLNFALESNGPDWPNPPSSTLLFRRLMENLTFRNKFINQFADELNSRFLPNLVEEHIESVALEVSSEIQNHFNRWGGDVGFHNSQLENMKRFGRLRPIQVKSHIKSEFNLPADHIVTLQVNNIAQGYIKVNSLSINVPSWSGDYFENVPITVRAIAKPGYVFSHWIGAPENTPAEYTVNIQANTALTAIFVPTDEESTVIINEINYNATDDHDTGDWIELYNPSIAPIDISQYIITDDEISDGYTIPQNTVLQGEAFIILSRNIDKFGQFHSDIENVLAGLNFGLSSQGDAIKLYSAEGLQVDSVTYLPDAPWPAEANGQGGTLELIQPDTDNSLASNWNSINTNGSPGLPNQRTSTIAESGSTIDLSLYPNPFVDEVELRLSLLKKDPVNATLYNLQGQKVITFIDNTLNAGDYAFSKNLNQLDHGVYLLEVQIGNQHYSYKWAK